MRFIFATTLLLLIACGESRETEPAAADLPSLHAMPLPDGGRVLIDGRSADAIWRQARPVKVALEGDGPAEVTLRAAYDRTAIFLLAQWRDEQPSLNRYWHYLGGTQWRLAQDEDGFSVCWAPGALEDAFREQGCTLFCHEDKHNYPAKDRGFADFWYWGAQRTNQMRQAIDMWLPFGPKDRLRGDGQPEGSGIEFNVSTEYYGPRYAPKRVGAQRGPFLTWDNTQVLTKDILLNRLKSSARPGWRIPCDVMRGMAGSRGDVMAAAQHVNDGWVLEMVRRLDTGHMDDKPVGDPLIPFFFSVAVHDNSGGAAHAVSGPIELRFVSKR